MRRLLFILGNLIVLLLTSCTNSDRSNTPSSNVDFVVSMCEDKMVNESESVLSDGVDRVYVDAFKSGYSVSFSDGAVGTFGKRSEDVRSVWMCGVSQNKVVYLSELDSLPVIDQLEKYPYENYDEDVKEYLHLRKDESFEFCCSQDFNVNNIKKHKLDFLK